MIQTLFPAGNAIARANLVQGMQLVSLFDLPVVLVADAVPPGLELHPLPDSGPLTVPIPVPFLPGMDSIEVESASLAIAGGVTERQADARRTGDEIEVKLPGADATASLRRLVIDGFRLTSEAAGLAPDRNAPFLVKETGGSGLVTGEASAVVPFLHLLVQPLDGSSAGAPAAAAPRFDMPGSGRARYGPALAGATLSVSAVSGGAVSLTLSTAPALSGTGFRIAFVHATDGKGASIHGGLPNETAGWPHWSMTGAHAAFATRPRDVEAMLAGPGPDAPAAVGSFPGPMPTARTDIDMTPAMRAIARAALPVAAGDDLGLRLQVTAAAGGDMRIAVPRPRLRYVKRPLAAPEVLALRGSRGELRLAVPHGLTPNGIGLLVDGRYGIPRLLDSVALPIGRVAVGYRLTPGRRLALPLALTTAEQLLPLRRLAVHGRSEGPAALLLGLAQGHGAVPGAAHGEPVAIAVEAGPAMDWHRGEWRAPALAPPHPARLFLTIEVTHGAFLMAVDTAGEAAARMAAAAGGWDTAAAPPLAAAWVDEADPVTGAPAPLHPLDLDGPGGPLNRDIAGVAGGSRPPGFILSWLAAAPAHAALLAAIGAGGGTLSLGFSSRRDVDLTLSDATLTYDPWAARG
jgi:hypothetical protein